MKFRKTASLFYSPASDSLQPGYTLHKAHCLLIRKQTIVRSSLLEAWRSKCVFFAREVDLSRSVFIEHSKANCLVKWALGNDKMATIASQEPPFLRTSFSGFRENRNTPSRLLDCWSSCVISVLVIIHSDFLYCNILKFLYLLKYKVLSFQILMATMESLMKYL